MLCTAVASFNPFIPREKTSPNSKGAAKPSQCVVIVQDCTWEERSRIFFVLSISYKIYTDPAIHGALQ